MLDVLSSSAERLQAHTGQHQNGGRFGVGGAAVLPCHGGLRGELMYTVHCAVLLRRGEPGPRNHTWPPVGIFNSYIDIQIGG